MLYKEDDRTVNQTIESVVTFTICDESSPNILSPHVNIFFSFVNTANALFVQYISLLFNKNLHE